MNDNGFKELLDKITKKTIEKIESIFNKLSDNVDIIDVEVIVEDECE